MNGLLVFLFLRSSRCLLSGPASEMFRFLLLIGVLELLDTFLREDSGGYVFLNIFILLRSTLRF